MSSPLGAVDVIGPPAPALSETSPDPAPTGSTGRDASRRRVRWARWTVGVLVALLYLPPVSSVALNTDMATHLVVAEQMSATGRAPIPYTLFQQLTIVVRTFLPFEQAGQVFPPLAERTATWEISAVLVIVASAVATAQLVLWRLLRDLTVRSRSAVLTSSLLTLGVMVAAPVSILTLSNRQMLIGYLTLNSYHNPTMMMSRPFALGLFLLVTARFFGRSGARPVALAAVLSVLALSAKPSYTVCLLPALGLLVVWHHRDWRRIDWRLLGLGVVLPSVLVLAMQGLAVPAGMEQTIEIAPFSVIENLLAWEGHPTWMFAVFLFMSLLFPLTVAACTGRTVEGIAWPAAWVTLGVGLAYFCLLEVTSYVDPGDFLWGAQVASFVLFAESTAVAIRRFGPQAELPPGGRPKLVRALLVVTFGLHVAAGLMFLVLETVDPATWW